MDMYYCVLLVTNLVVMATITTMYGYAANIFGMATTYSVNFMEKRRERVLPSSIILIPYDHRKSNLVHAGVGIHLLSSKLSLYLNILLICLKLPTVFTMLASQYTNITLNKTND